MDIKSKAEFQGKIIRKAMTDPDFRKDLLSNPKATIEKELGVKLPDNLNVKILEQTPDTFYLPLPGLEAASGELSEEELGQVAGGWHPHVCVCTNCSEYTSFDPNCTPDC